MSAYDAEMFNAALQSYEDGNMEEARRRTQDLLALTKDDAEVWCLEAQIRLALDDWPAMEFALDQALMLAPESSTAHLLQSHLFGANAQPEQACEAARRAVEFADDKAQEFEALTQLSESTFGLGQKMLEDNDDGDDWDDEGPMMTPEISEIFQEGMSIIKQAIDLARRPVAEVMVRRVVMVGLNGDGCTHCHFASPAIPCSSHCVCVSACLWL